MKDSYTQAVSFYICGKVFGKEDASRSMTYNDTSTAVGESLLNQGVTITALQNTVIYCNKFWKWRDKVVEQCCNGQLDKRLIELIFNKPLLIWKDNLNDMIEGADIVIAGDRDNTVQYTINEGYKNA